MKNNIDKQYLELCNQILKFGTQKKTRNGEVLSIFGWQIRHRMSEGFPLLTTKKMAWKTMVTELLWFLRGDTSIEYLLENDCNIWTGDCYRAYLEECRRLEEKDIENK
jgi:thymidylate synthase